LQTRKRKLQVAAVAISLTAAGLISGTASASPVVATKTCEVAGQDPVANPNYTQDTPLPELHDANLANNRITVETYNGKTMMLAEHLECQDGQPAIVKTPVSDTSTTWPTAEFGHDARGDFVEFKLAFKASKGVQLIQTDESVTSERVSTVRNPVFSRYSDGYYKYVIRGYITGTNRSWVSADVYVRRAGGVIFPTEAQALNVERALTAKTGRWPVVRKF